MDKKQVLDMLLQMSGLTEEEAAAYDKITDLACARTAARLHDGADAADARALSYAAALAYYMICLCEDAKNDFASFTAGDISITNSTARAEAAKQLLQSAEKSCAGMFCTDAFAFMGV